MLRSLAWFFFIKAITIVSMLSVILLSGGQGKRFCQSLPKQYYELDGKPLIQYSFETFKSAPWVDEIIVVCHSEYRALFESADIPIHFAMPGEERQDSVYSGLIRASGDYIAVHDGARPFVDLTYVRKTYEAAKHSQAAALAIPVKYTIRQGTQQRTKVLDRSLLWEVQTPQIIERSLFVQGFNYVRQRQLKVTDELSIVDAMGVEPVLVMGYPENIKITHRNDYLLAKELFREQYAAL